MKKRQKKEVLNTEFIELNVDGVQKADSGKYHEALQYFDKAIESDPMNFVSYFNRASVKMHLGDIEGAKIDFQLSQKLADNKIHYVIVWAIVLDKKYFLAHPIFK